MSGAERRMRRSWRRLERRAVATHERDLLAALRELAVVEAGVIGLQTRPEGLGSICLRLHGQELLLLGVSAQARLDALLLVRHGGVRVAEAGRYGRSWWLALTDGSTRVVVLASRLRLAPSDGGLGLHPQTSLSGPSAAR